MSTSDPQRQMLDKFVQALSEQGFLDENFSNQSDLHENRNTLSTFCGEAEPNLERVDNFLKMEIVDFQAVVDIMEHIKGNAARIGGKRVADACAELQQFCSVGDVEGSKEAYRKVTWEYYILRDCFHHILMAARTIHSNSDD